MYGRRTMTRLLWLVMVSGCLYEHGSSSLAPVDGGPNRPCGRSAGVGCRSDELCVFPRHTCGTTDERGTCEPRPKSCDSTFVPVCGCDGAIHDNACDANAAGVDVNDNGTCMPAPGELACGSRICQKDTEYCEHRFAALATDPDQFTCKLLPGNCSANGNCSCLVGVACGMFCTGSTGEGFTLSCMPD